VHAIRFGEFYLKAYDNEVSPSDLKEIFRDWNINIPNTSFSSKAGADFDPKLLENVVGNLEKLKGLWAKN
jgi:hypothetical protein